MNIPSLRHSRQPTLAVALAVLLVLGTGFIIAAADKPVVPGSGYEFANNGKNPGPALEKTYTLNAPACQALPPAPTRAEAVTRQVAYLETLDRKKTFTFDDLTLTGDDLMAAGKALQQALQKNDPKWLEGFRCFQIKGEDGCGNVHFTGYFTPQLDARLEPDKEFRFPLYALPNMATGTFPVRQAIDHENALAGKKLELAWAKDFLDVYFLHVQGSGLLRFADGTTKRIGYAGGNGQKYYSIGRHLVTMGAVKPEAISLKAIRKWFEQNPDQMIPLLNKNPSYCFFRWMDELALGAAGIPLSPMHSVAVDPKFIPYGACLLGELPVLDDNGVLTGHRWEVVFAHDTGGAIKGPGHLDIYHGVGREAGDRAGDLHHYGRLWLLLPK